MPINYIGDMYLHYHCINKYKDMYFNPAFHLIIIGLILMKFKYE